MSIGFFVDWDWDCVWVVGMCLGYNNGPRRVAKALISLDVLTLLTLSHRSTPEDSDSDSDRDSDRNTTKIELGTQVIMQMI